MNLRDWFKSKPYWLKGGIIGLVFILIFMILFYINEFLRITHGSFWAIVSTPFTVPYLFVTYLITSMMLTKGVNGDIPQLIYDPSPPKVSSITILSFVLVLLSYFLLGAFIGWIVGKIKSKK